MRQVWVLVVVAVAVAIILLPRLAAAEGSSNCWSVGGCGEVKDGLDSHLFTNPLNWKCVKADFRPMFPALPVCPVNRVKMNKPVPMPITFGAAETPGGARGK